MAHHNNRNKKAFTLAEVLITLGIIGVVAMMTLPAMINKYRQMVKLNQFKNSLAVVSEGILRSIPDGDFSNFDISSSNDFQAPVRLYEYLKKNFNIVKFCANDTDVKKNCFPTTVGIGSNLVGFVLSNGQSVAIDSWFGNSNDIAQLYELCGVKVKSTSSYFFTVFVDINGVKGPNEFGQDRMVFVLTQKGSSLAGVDFTDEQLRTECKSSGKTCLELIRRNSWKVPKDYPTKF